MTPFIVRLSLRIELRISMLKFVPFWRLIVVHLVNNNSTFLETMLIVMAKFFTSDF